MQKLIDLYLLGIKGLSVLEELIHHNFKDMINYVVVGEDKLMLDDSYEKIIEICEKHLIPFIERKNCESIQLDGMYSFAVGWKWMIDTQSFLIVFHDSILPRYRGFAPTVSQLINGEEYLGVTAFKANKNYDEGDIITSSRIRITYPIKIKEAFDRLRNCYSTCALNILSTLKSGGSLDLIKQDHSQATYSLWRDEKDYQINWGQTATQIIRFIDAVGYPYRGAKAKLNNDSIRVYNAHLVPDRRIENRDIGKVIDLLDDKPVIVCGVGLLCINEGIYEESGASILPLRKFRSRFS